LKIAYAVQTSKKGNQRYRKAEILEVMTQNSSSARMKIGVILDIDEGTFHGRSPSYRDLRQLAQVAEQVGFDSLWLADHLIFRFPGKEENGTWEAFTLLGALAEVTQRVEIGPLVACTSFREPALLAKMADTLDDISGGRFILGLGAGWHQPEYEAFGYPFDPLAGRFEEALQIIVPLLREGHVDFQGQYYQVRNCVLRPRGPSPKGPPILIGAFRPRMLRLVARYADAWNTVWPIDPQVVKERYDAFKQVCAEAGRDPSTIELTAGTIVRPSQAGESTNGKEITGSPEEIARQLQGFADVGVTHLMIAPATSSVEDIEQFGPILEMVHAA
jgi:probable F420-dependent oxidoreductase